MTRAGTSVTATEAGDDSAARRRGAFGTWNGRRVVAVIRAVALIALIVAAFSTPDFTSRPSIYAQLTTMSFIGCVAVGMTFITISGNIMSFALGATAAATTLVFVGALDGGLGLSIFLALLLAAAITGVQGVIVGVVRANPIIVTIAALALITGGAELVTGGQSVYYEGNAHRALRGRVLGVPAEFWYLVTAVVIGQLILSFTRFGRNIYMVGSNHAAAEAAGIRTWRTVTGVFAIAGVFTAFTGIMLAARYGTGNMEYGLGYDYEAIASVLVGGTAIHGGQGSVIRTLVGVAVISTVQAILLLNGLADEWKFLITGLIVLGAVMLHTVGERH